MGVERDVRNYKTEIPGIVVPEFGGSFGDQHAMVAKRERTNDADAWSLHERIRRNRLLGDK